MRSQALKKHLEQTIERLSFVGIFTEHEKDLPYGVQLSLAERGASCRINLYSGKKGNSVVPAGGDGELLSKVMRTLAASTIRPVPAGLRVGSDEAGKGDYFGPLVVAAVSCDHAASVALRAVGVADSKKLSRVRVEGLYKKITEMDEIKYAVFSLPPRKYNSFFADFKAKGKNSLDILAMAHGKVIGQLYSDGTVPDAVVVDKFCGMNRLEPWLAIPASEVELRERAEDSEPAVAAASVIARSVYMEELAVLSSKFGVGLTPGAGASVDRLAKKLVHLHGGDVLRETAKLHFANTQRVLL